MFHLFPRVAVLLFLALLPSLLHAETIQDKDNDGIPDSWETTGFVNITLPDGTKQKLDLTKDGPLSPDHKDIFVWVAWMENSTHSHKPSPVALQIVKDAFAKAPIDNLDGKSGISLHVYFNSKAISEVSMLGTTDGDGNYSWTAFDKIKQQVFPKELEHVFHFCIFAHDIDTEHHSGMSKDIGGYDFIVSLGAFGLNGVADTQSQAGTFMHELGHNLGLRHGGSDDVNNKPNYISVMNYFFQLDGVPINGQPANFDYSRFALDADESSLHKEVGLNVSPALAIYGSQYFCANHSNSVTIDSIGSPIDWDCSGTLTGKVAADINGDGKFSPLPGFNDWQAVRLAFPSTTSGVTPKTTLRLREELSLGIANTISLPPVAHIQAAALSGGVKIWWQQVPLDRVVAYRVFRKSSAGEQVELATVERNILVDTPPVKGAYSYFVTALYVPFGNAQAEKPAEFFERPLGKIIANDDIIAGVAASAPLRMKSMETMGVKPRSQSGVSPPPYLVETTPSAPASIVVQ